MKMFLSIFAALVCASNSYAQYVGPTVAPTTVSALLADGKDDTAVNYRGK